MSEQTEQTTEATKAENPRAWLEDCCGYWDQIRTPFLVELDGETYECATNGHGIVALRGAGVTTRTDGPETAAGFFVPASTELAKVDVQDLADWGEAVECRCGTCDFSGCVEERHPIKVPFRYGRLFGRAVDRWYLWLFLREFTGEVTVRSEPDPLAPIQFFGDGWIVTIMPLDPNKAATERARRGKDDVFPRPEAP